MTRQEQKAAAFRALHEGDPFVIPNPWDVGSARVLQALGFKALATTSSGFSFTLGRLDGGATLEELVGHVRAIDSATDVTNSASDRPRARSFTCTCASTADATPTARNVSRNSSAPP